MLYAGCLEIFIEASDLFTHAVFRLVVIHKMTSLDCIFRKPERRSEGAKSGLKGGWGIAVHLTVAIMVCGLALLCRQRTWFTFLFRSTLGICCFNFLYVCTYHSWLIVAPLFTNFTKKFPSESHKTLAMTLPVEICTLNLFSLICLTVPI